MTTEPTPTPPAAVIPKNGHQRVHVDLTEFKGRHFADVRVFYEADDGAWKPTQKGAAVPLAGLSALIDGLREVDRMARERGLLSDGDGADDERLPA